MFIVLLGAPGSGKGTLSRKLVDEKQFVHISSGDAFRSLANSKSNKKKIIKLKKTIDSGKLVDDETVFKVITEKLNQYDFKTENIILDGVPRTIKQAQLLAKFIFKNNIENIYFISLDLKLNFLKERVLGRMICPTCGRIYNEKVMKPKREWFCDFDDSPLEKREDDNDTQLEERFKEYEEKTKPLFDFYDNLIIHLDASKTKNEIYNDLLRKIKLN